LLLVAAVVVEGGLLVDKDVKLMRDYFGLEESFADMSPLVIPSGYTKNYVDGKVKVLIAVMPQNSL
jgi:phosphate acetyltransferase